MQKDDQNDEQPIYFMSASLQGPELNYPTVDKQASIVYKDVKNLCPYLLKNHCIIFVLYPAFKSQFFQQGLGERRENWMTSLQEYDLEFKLVHTIKVHGLCWLAIEAVSATKDDPS